ncbi:MAG TPA: hypothetical protein VFN50_04655, partial [Acidimicrobiales bacterium]|nr:hypothetical protein [Acidimicrobiales bacterium]
SADRSLVEALGQRWYRQATRSLQAAGVPVTAGMRVVEQIADRFDDARRCLNAVTDRYLFPLRDQWFQAG